MYSLLLEKGFGDSVWCHQIVQGLTAELKKRRETFCISEELPELDSDSTVFVIGSAPGWLSQIVGQCNSQGNIPILLCNSSRRIPGGQHHCVCSNIAGSMRQLTAVLKQTYGTRIALYGINPDSVGDRSRVEAFSMECPEKSAIYENSGSLAECFQRFFPHRKQYDAVICANGFAAISLVRRLKEQTRDGLIPIISCAQALLCQYYGEQIVSVDMNYGQFGKTALALADLAKKQPHIAELTASVKWSVQDIILGKAKGTDVWEKPKGAFYDDEELQQMLKLENLLNICDNIDRYILQQMLIDKSFDTIAQACYLTEGAVKYRVRKMRILCGCEDRQQLMTLLREYIPDYWRNEKNISGENFEKP